MSLKKILIVTPHYPPRWLGGTELHTLKLVNWLKSNGFVVEIVCVEELTPGERNSLLGQLDFFEDVPVHRLYLTHNQSLTAFRHSYDHPDIQIYLEQIVSKQPPDLIHLMSGYLGTAGAIRVARKHNIPIVVTLNDYWFVCSRINLIRSNGQICDGPHSALDCTRCLLEESRRYRLPAKFFPGITGWFWQALSYSETLKKAVPLYREVSCRTSMLVDLLNQADAVTIPTNSLRGRLVRAGITNRFHLSRHGIELEHLKIQQDTPKSKSERFRFGYLGQVSFLKGVDLLVDAYRALGSEYEDISLTIWGGTTDQPRYAAKLRELLEGTPGIFLGGRYEPTQVGELLRDIDMLIVPSRAPEIGPLVILEALAAKTPVIAAQTGNMPELIEHGVNGLLFEPDSATDLQSQMHRVLDEPRLYEHLQAGITPVRTHNAEMAELMEIYSQVLEKRPVDRQHS